MLLPAYVSVEHFVVIEQGAQFRLSFSEYTFPVAVILFPSRSVPLVSCCVLLPAYVSVEHFVVIGQGVQFRLSFFEHTFPVFILSLSPVPAGTAL